LRDALELMDGLRFRSQKEKHELSHLYEAKIKNMGNAGRNGGEYYTPRPLIRAMIQVVKPKIGERIYDGALGSAGFLCEAHDYLRQGELTTSQLQTLQTRTFYGKEKKSLAYVIAIMNMILHGIEVLQADAQSALGKPEEALASVIAGLKAVEKTGGAPLEAELWRLRGEAFLAGAGTLSEAEAAIEKGIDVARRQNAKSWELRGAMSLARLWAGQSRRGEARDLLAPVYAWFTEGFDTADLKEAKALLDKLTEPAIAAEG
jgi:hypothetical protein